MSSQSREKILGKIKTALQESSVPMPFPEADKATEFFAEDAISPEEKFAAEFSKLGGKYVYCSNELELFSQLEALRDAMKWKQIHTLDSYLNQLAQEHQLDYITRDNTLQNIEVGISLTECLVARTGSVIMSSAMDYGRRLPVYAPIHIVVAYANQVVWNISDAIEYLQKKYPKGLPSMIALTTGPSRTADIEKTLVVGVHGPKEVYVFFVDKQT